MLSDEEKYAINTLEYVNRWRTNEDKYTLKALEAIDTVLNLIEKQSKEIEELKEQCKEVVCVPEGTCFMLESKDINKKWEDKIKAKIGEKMQKNNNIIHNAKLKYGKDYVYYDDVQEARKENYIYKGLLQSLLEKE